jgi:hypothetical protein
MSEDLGGFNYDGNAASALNYGTYQGPLNPGLSYLVSRNYATRDPIGGLNRFASDELNKLQVDQSQDLRTGLQNIADRRGLQQQVTRQVADADQAADVAEGVFARRTAGMDLSDRQRAGAQQRFNLNREVTKAAAASNARRNAARSARIADSALTSFEDVALGQQGAMLTGLANAEGQRKIRLAQERSARKQQRASNIGTAISTVASIAAAAFAFSSEKFKAPTEKNPQLLEKLKKVRVDKWKYHGGDRDHIGPYAEEFNQTFGVGKDHQRYLDLVDVVGVTLGAVKELNEKVEARQNG